MKAVEGERRSVHARVAGWGPARPAILSGESCFTYGDLAKASDHLLARLKAKGVRPGDRVALVAERSPQAVAALLATLKAGAAYVPVDPSSPGEVQRFILADAAPTAVFADRLDAVDDAAIPLVTNVFSTSTAPLADPVTAHDSRADDPCCVMYTSGSTGAPKGVVVPHRAVVRLTEGQTYARFDEEQTFLSLAPLPFDASTLEIWGALMHGAKLGIVGSPRPSIGEIAEAIRQCGVSTLWLTAGLFHAMVDHALESFAPVKTLIAGGDVLSPQHVATFRRRHPHIRLVNGYGPTENTTFTCCFPVTDDNWDGRSALPIGWPIAGTHVALLDADLNPVSEGAVGELCASGNGVALGYLNRPELTREKFLPNQVPALPGPLLYRTGDLARRRADGAYEFLGRADRQVKINGKRVELDGIEALLRADMRIADAVVCKSDSDGVQGLVAFCVLHPSANRALSTDPRALLEDLRARAAPEMTPSRILVVDALPLTANGKVDRAALLDRLAALRTHDGPGAADSVAKVLAEVFGLAQLDQDVNFFDAGATSLHLVRAHARLEQELGKRFPLQALFDHPRLRALSDFLTAANAGDLSPAPSPDRTRGSRQAAALRDARARRARPST